ncbi:uncharacterized protein E0L32_011590 [Thyridium curvatum]|uniref:Metallo-beta-lactamase domain-containing protein n=1 Tax=Thyridium curvatum TaxID=1093900 RepID=A0A507BET4_9PEZI|nr:uncharacterized protein E0L32_011590 [Thyridium curvatum]TPX18477.1 hypothetical protein E0L32_011590 [Thyridium curvatum]
MAQQPAQKPAAPKASKVHFATPLAQSTRSSILEWRLPRPHHQYVLTGRSRAAWHTSFVVPQLNLLLDAGLVVNSLRPKHVFITHGHNDHCLLSPAFVKREDPPDVVCPAEMAGVFDAYIAANSALNLGGAVDLGSRAPSPEDEDEDEDGEDGEDTPGSGGSAPSSVAGPGYLHTHVTHGVRHGDVVPLRRTKNISAQVFACDHSVPSVGYVFRATTHRLRPEHASKTGPELRALRQAGEEITAPATTPFMAFLGDGTAATLAAEPEWLRGGIPVVITECSFLHEEHRAQAARTKHTLWADLEPVVRKFPRTTFVLTHFSLRYSDRVVANFFRDMADPPANIVIWADGEAEEGAGCR